MSELAAMQRNYSSNFYDSQGGESARSAQAVVPYLMEVLSPANILDVGCGIGAWVQSFSTAGVKTAHGLDGPWAREGGLLIPEQDFCEFDFLNNPPPFRPLGLLDRYDLVTTFEFVEHLSGELAPLLADFFTSKADTIIVGCAIPGQGGSHHVNEQWPTYWTALMQERGYEACDFIRPAIWDDQSIMPWYRQNSIAYFKDKVPSHVRERAGAEWNKRISAPMNIVHPDLFSGKCAETVPNAQNLAWMADRLTRNVVKKLIGRS